VRVPVSVSADEICFFLLEFDLESNGSKEWLEVVEKILLLHIRVKVQKI
jgi:hypothetical protein